MPTHDPIGNAVIEPNPSLPPVSDLLKQLRGDAEDFVRSEASYLRAQASERVSHARLGVILIAVGAAISIGVIAAMPVGAMLVLTPVLGPGWAFASVALGGIAIGSLTIMWGTSRIKAALKNPEER